MKLQEIRKSKKLTQKQLSELSGVPLRTIQIYEIGQRNIDGAGLDVLCALALALDVHILLLQTTLCVSPSSKYAADGHDNRQQNKSCNF